LLFLLGDQLGLILGPEARFVSCEWSLQVSFFYFLDWGSDQRRFLLGPLKFFVRLPQYPVGVHKCLSVFLLNIGVVLCMRLFKVRSFCLVYSVRWRALTVLLVQTFWFWWMKLYAILRWIEGHFIAVFIVFILFIQTLSWLCLWLIWIVRR